MSGNFLFGYEHEQINLFVCCLFATFCNRVVPDASLALGPKRNVSRVTRPFLFGVLVAIIAQDSRKLATYRNEHLRVLPSLGGGMRQRHCEHAHTWPRQPAGAFC